MFSNLLPSERGKIGFMIHRVMFADHRSGKDGIQLVIWFVFKQARITLWSWKHNRKHADTAYWQEMFKDKKRPS